MSEEKIKLNVDFSLYTTSDFNRKSPGVHFVKNSQKEEIAPIPGIIREVSVREGSKIEKGDTLYIIEAMKSYNKILSEYRGRIIALKIKEGDKVKKGDIVLYRSDN
ncbi:acetyl-CoA carboxylase biotin carboxyl carrier protein subunit [candidate division WOR-3 bacterium]|nr:acetyl-CoA carboxylase biotin carboxyl carrier protein subunit [candidate division WOR-3 bacterium]